MQGQRILDRLATGPVSYRGLEKRVSAKYRKESFKADIQKLKEDGVVYFYREGRTRFVALSCPGETEPPKSPAVAVRNTTTKFHVGDLVLVAKKTETRANGWDNSWEAEVMDQMIGQQAVIKSVSGGSNDYLLPVNDVGHLYGFPEESLLLVRHAEGENVATPSVEDDLDEAFKFLNPPVPTAAQVAVAASLVSAGCGGSPSVQSQDQLEPIVEKQTVETVGARVRVNTSYYEVEEDKQYQGQTGVVLEKTHGRSTFVNVRLDSGEKFLFFARELDLFDQPESTIEKSQLVTIETVGARVRVNDTVNGTDKQYVGQIATVIEKTWPTSPFIQVKLSEGTALFYPAELDLVVDAPQAPVDVPKDFAFSKPEVENVLVPDYQATDSVEKLFAPQEVDRDDVPQVDYEPEHQPQENPQHGEPGHTHRFGDEDIIDRDEVTMGEVDGMIALVLPDRVIANIHEIFKPAYDEVVREMEDGVNPEDELGPLQGSSLIPVGALVIVNENYPDPTFHAAIGTVTGYTEVLEINTAVVKIDDLGFHGLEYLFAPYQLTVLTPTGCGSAKAQAALSAPYTFEESGSYDTNWFIPLEQSVTNKLLRISKHLANMQAKSSGCIASSDLNAAQKTLRQTFKLFV